MRTNIFSKGHVLTRSEAWSCALINQLATPGLGTLIGRKFISGALQCAVSVTGFCLIMTWFIQKMRLLYGQMFGTTMPLNAGNKAGWLGLIFFAAAWLWSLVSSIQLVRNAPEAPMSIPPVIGRN